MKILYYLKKTGEVVCGKTAGKFVSIPGMIRVWGCDTADRLSLMRALVGMKNCMKAVSHKRLLKRRIKDIEKKNNITVKDYKFCMLIISGFSYAEAYQLAFGGLTPADRIGIIAKSIVMEEF